MINDQRQDDAQVRQIKHLDLHRFLDEIQSDIVRLVRGKLVNRWQGNRGPMTFNIEWERHRSTMTIDVQSVFDLRTCMTTNSSLFKDVLSHLQCSCDTRTFDNWENDVILDSLLYVPSDTTLVDKYYLNMYSYMFSELNTYIDECWIRNSNTCEMFYVDDNDMDNMSDWNSDCE